MSTELAQDYSEVIKYSVTQEAIQAMRDECLPIVVKDWMDVEGYSAAKEAKKKVVKARTTVDKERQKLKKYFLEGGRAVDAPAKEIFAAIEPVESHLQAQIDVVEKELERQEAEKVRKFNEESSRRVNELQSYRAQFDHTAVSMLSPEDYAALRDKEKARYEADEKARIDQEKELEELRKLRAEQEAKIKEQEERERKTQRKLIAQQQAEIAARDAALAEERRQREEEARKVEEARKQKEAQELKAKQEQEAERQKALAKAAKAAKDKAMFEAVQKEFPTIEAAWVEIVKLRKQIGGE